MCLLLADMITQSIMDEKLADGIITHEEYRAIFMTTATAVSAKCNAWIVSLTHDALIPTEAKGCVVLFVVVGLHAPLFPSPLFNPPSPLCPPPPPLLSSTTTTTIDV